MTVWPRSECVQDLCTVRIRDKASRDRQFALVLVVVVVVAVGAGGKDEAIDMGCIAAQFVIVSPSRG